MFMNKLLGKEFISRIASNKAPDEYIYQYVQRRKQKMKSFLILPIYQLVSTFYEYKMRDKN